MIRRGNNLRGTSTYRVTRIISEETGIIIETQDALGHKNLATTRIYVGRIAVKRDKHSLQVTARVDIRR